MEQTPNIPASTGGITNELSNTNCLLGGEYVLEFGKHKNLKLNAIPRDYVEWMIKSNKEQPNTKFPTAFENAEYFLKKK